MKNVVSRDTADGPVHETAPPAELDGLVPGRIVHYWPYPHESMHASPGPWAAIVTRVLEGGVVTLNVQIPVSRPVGNDPVDRFEDVHHSAEKAEGCWSWMFDGQGARYKP